MLALQGENTANEGVTLLLLNWMANSHALTLVECIPHVALVHLIQIALRIVKRENLIRLLNCLQKIIQLLRIHELAKEWESILVCLSVVPRSGLTAEENGQFLEIASNIFCSVFLSIGSISNWKLFRQFVSLAGNNALHASACSKMLTIIQEQRPEGDESAAKEWKAFLNILPNSPYQITLCSQSFQILCVFEALAINYGISFGKLMCTGNALPAQTVVEVAIKSFCLLALKELAFEFDTFLAKLLHEWFKLPAEKPSIQQHCYNFYVANAFSFDRMKVAEEVFEVCFQSLQSALFSGVTANGHLFCLSPSLTRIFMDKHQSIDLATIQETQPNKMHLTNGEELPCCSVLHEYLSKEVDKEKLFICQLTQC